MKKGATKHVRSFSVGSLENRVGFKDKNLLPDAGAIYFVLGESDRILYIGCTASLIKRWRHHSYSRRLSAAGAAFIAYIPVSRIYDGRTGNGVEFENELIKRFKPPFNTKPIPALYTASCGTCISPECLADLRLISRYLGMSRSDLVREFLMNGVESVKQNHPEIAKMIELERAASRLKKKANGK